MEQREMIRVGLPGYRGLVRSNCVRNGIINSNVLDNVCEISTITLPYHTGSHTCFCLFFILLFSFCMIWYETLSFT